MAQRRQIPSHDGCRVKFLAGRPDAPREILVDERRQVESLHLHVVQREADFADFGAVALEAEPTAAAEVTFGIRFGGGRAKEAGIAAHNL